MNNQTVFPELVQVPPFNVPNHVVISDEQYKRCRSIYSGMALSFTGYCEARRIDPNDELALPLYEQHCTRLRDTVLRDEARRSASQPLGLWDKVVWVVVLIGLVAWGVTSALTHYGVTA